MNTQNSQVLPAPPRLFRTLAAGFDTITNHISLILYPIGLDLLIWLAPSLRLKELIERMVGDLVTQTQNLSPDVQTTQMLTTAQELWTLAGEQFNALSILRSYPVGISSLMVSVPQSGTPFGVPDPIEIKTLIGVAGVFLLLTFIGLVLGTLYYQTVAQATILNEVRWNRVLADWPWLSLQVVLLALTWFVLLLGVSIPAGCAISLAAMGSMAFGQCAILLYGGFLIWIIFPLLFSAHGIFIHRKKVWPSIKQGILITKMTFPTTSLFFVVVLLSSQGLDLLWRIPPVDSWLMLIGLAGHAFVTTGLLSASFLYYRDAEIWIRDLQNRSSPGKNSDVPL
jgi:hypothetical protein